MIQDFKVNSNTDTSQKSEIVREDYSTITK